MLIFYNPDLIPSPKDERNYCYDNKPLKDWEPDDFAEYILDNSDMDHNFTNHGTFIHTMRDETTLEYLDHIPKLFARVYLYGVWEVFKSRIQKPQPV